MKKRLTAILAVILMVFTNTVFYINASAEGNTPALMYSCLDFEEQSAGDKPYGLHWNWGEDYISVVNAAVSGNQSNKAVRLTYSGEGDIPRMLLPLHYAPIKDNFVLGFKFKCDNVNAFQRLMVSADATIPDNSLYLTTTGTAFNLMSVKSGKLYSGTSASTRSVSKNTWYDVEYEVNMSTKKMNVYLNNSKILSDVSISGSSVTNIAGLTFLAPDAAAGWYIDDLRLYLGSRLSSANFASLKTLYENSEIVPEHKYELGRLYQYDKFVFITLYNKFVARVDGERYYKNNAYHALSAPVTEYKGEISVPLRDFAEAFGGTCSVSDDTVTVSGGTNTVQLTVGEDVSDNDGVLYINLDTLTSFFGIAYYKNGDLISFGENLTCPFDLGVMGKNQRGYTMQEEVFERISNSLVYDRPSKAQILEAFETNNPQHVYPRLLINDFGEIINNRSRDASYSSTVAALITRADNYVNQNPVEYTKSDGLRGDFAQPLSDRGTYLSFAYKITGDVKYKNALWSNIEAVAAFPDLNPSHFLDVGISANGIKFAYDWLYDDWTPAQKQILENIMLDKILAPAMTAYRTPLGTSATGFAYSTGNQPIIINCGVAGCALALLDKYPAICSEVIACSLRSVETCLDEFAPDGAWTEGVAYWQDTMGSLPALVSIYKTALGDDYGLLRTPGLHKSAYFPLAVSGASGTFPLGDDTSVSPYHASLMWFANVYNDTALATMRKNSLNGASLTDVVNWVFDSGGEQVTIDNDHYFRKMETATMRTGWNVNDTAAILHGGLNSSNHGHLDNGTFQIDMLGERWACEVPNENYNVLHYGSYTFDPSTPASPYEPVDYYRFKAEGHNTVIANLGDERCDQETDAFSEIVSYNSSDRGSFAILDMTQTNKLYQDAKRGLMLDKLSDTVIIQDDFKATQQAEFWWFMHTQASITLGADGKTAILEKNGKRVWVSIISDGDETFQVMSAAPMEGYYAIPPLQGSNSDYRKLAVTKTTDEFKISVAVKPLYGNDDEPAVIPSYKPMNAWGFEEVIEDTDDYRIKGMADGDRFPLTLGDAAAQKCNVYVVNSDATGITPSPATGLVSASFYVDGELSETVYSAPFCFEVPLETGEHTLRVIVRKNDGVSYHVGTFDYSGEYLIDTDDSVIEDFDSKTPGSAVTFGSERSFAANESVTYETAPGGSTAISFSSTAGSGTSYFITDSVAVPGSKLVTFDYDIYSANSSGNMITHHLRNGVPGYTFGTLGSSKTTKETWHHVSYVFDFQSLTFRGYLDGYEMERGTLNNVASNKIRFYMTRYTDAAVVYADNFKFCGKADASSALEPTPYAVNGIADGEKIPVSPKGTSLMRTVSVVNADATGKTVTQATNLAKADFYIDNVKKATVTANPCQWIVPITDLNNHYLTVETTDTAGNKQTLGPYSYTAYSMTDGASSHTQYFDGEAGGSLTLASLPRMNASSSSGESPQYAEIAGSTGTSLKLTGTSGKSSNFQTSQDILVPQDGFVTFDLDFYATSRSSNNKLYFRSRNGSGYNMKNGNLTLIDGLSMADVSDYTWHHISFVFDVGSASYVFILDGYEIERGVMDSRVAGRQVYFQIATQNYGACDWYFDNLEIMSKTVSSKANGAFTDGGETANAVVLNGGNTTENFDIYHAEYDNEGYLLSVSIEKCSVAAKGIWQGDVSAVPVLGNNASLYIWNSELVPLSKPFCKTE